MGARIAINGFGRMGRLALRAAWAADHDAGQKKARIRDFEIVHINEPNCDAALSAHLLEFDSVHGRWPFAASAEKDTISIGDRQLSYSQGKTLKEVDWRRRGIDVVIECSGKYKSVDQLAPYFEAGVKKVVVSAPIKKDAVNIVLGVNDNQFDLSQHSIVTAASCTTNCLAPVVQVIHRTFGIKHGMITTIHNVTNTQTVIDKPAKDFRRARSALLNLIPTTTGSATAIGLIFPELQGRLDGIAIRVPLLNASITDCVFEVNSPTTREKVNEALRAAAEDTLRGIMAFEPRPLVSTDYRGNTHSSIIDGLSTMVTNGTQVKIIAWYDNEMGYAHRLHELARKIASTLDSPSTQASPKTVAAEKVT